MSFIGTAIKTVREFIIPTGFYLSINGKCPCCDSEVNFSTTKIWLRDHLICPKCQSRPRERSLSLIIEKYFPAWKTMQVYEASGSETGTSKQLVNHCEHLSMSHFIPSQPTGVEINGMRNESLEELTYADSSFDIVVSQDVMEHVYNPEKAFKEIARVLKAGGAYIFTVPLVNKFNPTQRWATLGGGGVLYFFLSQIFMAQLIILRHIQ